MVLPYIRMGTSGKCLEASISIGQLCDQGSWVFMKWMIRRAIDDLEE